MTSKLRSSFLLIQFMMWNMGARTQHPSFIWHSQCHCLSHGSQTEQKNAHKIIHDHCHSTLPFAYVLPTLYFIFTLYNHLRPWEPSLWKTISLGWRLHILCIVYIFSNMYNIFLNVFLTRIRNKMNRSINKSYIGNGQLSPCNALISNWRPINRHQPFVCTFAVLTLLVLFTCMGYMCGSWTIKFDYWIISML